VLLLCAAVMVGARGADAHHGPDSMFKTANYNPDCKDGGMGDTYCQTDNDFLRVFRESSLSSAWMNMVAFALVEFDRDTDLRVKYDSAPTYSGSSETDIIDQVGSIPFEGLIGIAWCNDAVSTLRCDQHYVRLSPNASVNYELVCHETGHAVGLTHPDDAHPRSAPDGIVYGCMRTLVPLANETLRQHNEFMINITY